MDRWTEQGKQSDLDRWTKQGKPSDFRQMDIIVDELSEVVVEHDLRFQVGTRIVVVPTLK